MNTDERRCRKRRTVKTVTLCRRQSERVVPGLDAASAQQSGGPCGGFDVGGSGGVRGDSTRGGRGADSVPISLLIVLANTSCCGAVPRGGRCGSLTSRSMEWSACSKGQSMSASSKEGRRGGRRGGRSGTGAEGGPKGTGRREGRRGQTESTSSISRPIQQTAPSPSVKSPKLPPNEPPARNSIASIAVENVLPSGPQTPPPRTAALHMCSAVAGAPDLLVLQRHAFPSTSRCHPTAPKTHDPERPTRRGRLAGARPRSTSDILPLLPPGRPGQDWLQCIAMRSTNASRKAGKSRTGSAINVRCGPAPRSPPARSLRVLGGTKRPANRSAPAPPPSARDCFCRFVPLWVT